MYLEKGSVEKEAVTSTDSNGFRDVDNSMELKDASVDKNGFGELDVSNDNGHKPKIDIHIDRCQCICDEQYDCIDCQCKSTAIAHDGGISNQLFLTQKDQVNCNKHMNPLDCCGCCYGDDCLVHSQYSIHENSTNCCQCCFQAPCAIHTQLSCSHTDSSECCECCRQEPCSIHRNAQKQLDGKCFDCLIGRSCSTHGQVASTEDCKCSSREDCKCSNDCKCGKDCDCSNGEECNCGNDCRCTHGTKTSDDGKCFDCLMGRRCSTHGQECKCSNGKECKCVNDCKLGSHCDCSNGQECNCVNDCECGNHCDCSNGRACNCGNNCRCISGSKSKADCDGKCFDCLVGGKPCSVHGVSAEVNQATEQSNNQCVIYAMGQSCIVYTLDSGRCEKCKREICSCQQPAHFINQGSVRKVGLQDRGNDTFKQPLRHSQSTHTLDKQIHGNHLKIRSAGTVLDKQDDDMFKGPVIPPISTDFFKPQQFSTMSTSSSFSNYSIPRLGQLSAKKSSPNKTASSKYSIEDGTLSFLNKQATIPFHTNSSPTISEISEDGTLSSSGRFVILKKSVQQQGGTDISSFIHRDVDQKNKKNSGGNFSVEGWRDRIHEKFAVDDDFKIELKPPSSTADNDSAIKQYSAQSDHSSQDSSPHSDGKKYQAHLERPKLKANRETVRFSNVPDLAHKRGNLNFNNPEFSNNQNDLIELDAGQSPYDYQDLSIAAATTNSCGHTPFVFKPPNDLTPGISSSSKIDNSPAMNISSENNDYERLAEAYGHYPKAGLMSAKIQLAASSGLQRLKNTFRRKRDNNLMLDTPYEIDEPVVEIGTGRKSLFQRWRRD